MKRCRMDFSRLADFVEGRADAAESARIQQHLNTGCAHCLKEVAWLKRTLGAMQAMPSVDVPERLLKRAQSLFRERFPAPERPSLLALLQFDSRTTLSLAGARGAAEEAFQLVFSTPTHDIDIWEEPAEAGKWYLIGQALPREGDTVLLPQEVVLTSAGGAEITVTPEMPEFHLPDVPAGIYQLTVRLEDSDILIPEFSVGMTPQ